MTPSRGGSAHAQSTGPLHLLPMNLDVYWLGVSFPGEFIEKTGPSRGSDFLYGAIQYTF